MQLSQYEPTTWPLINRILFRVFSVYLVFYYGATFVPRTWWDKAVTWAGKLLIGKDYHIEAWPAGSGDTTFNYLQLFCILLAALAGCLLWSVIDRKRKNYDKIQYWVMVVLCYQLAIVMFRYGVAKVFPGQFAAPSLYKLDQPLGESSPMGLAWTFMGYSRGYTIFSGIAECLGGLLLLFRRTRLLGALVCIAVMTNVVAMNFFYDICVKLFSSHLLLTALFLLTPDIKRLARFFLTQQPVAATTRYYPVFATRWKRYVFNTVRYLAVAWVLWGAVATGISIRQSVKQLTTEGAIYGTYEVTSFKSLSLPGETTINRPAWRKLYFEKGRRLLIRDDSGVTGGAVRIDIGLRTIETTINKNVDTVNMHYTLNFDNTMIMKGTIGHDSVQIHLQKKDTDHYLLMTRGFHWVNETSFNK
ncbi:hypothetical protein SAMN04488128_103291 [Chitinophaga eiseniae]|uniref:DoxX protein n=1 Tax=Chitinophaga eiseniae TaxID=634771 RepID=A0A1T4SQA1_9BACT|nr:hypothetical protein [Chitinophaga eiseniae]SKA30405.1 hypothetical protein SAMN04488128_103291 [Chitinophaga eiseniae]